MAKKITHDELIERGLFNPTIESAKELTKALDALEAQFKDILTASQKSLKENPLKSYSDVKKVSADVNKVKQAVKGLDKVQKEQVKNTQKITKATNEEVKAKLELQKATKEQKDELSTLIVLQDKEAGTLEKLAANNKRLRAERQKLNLDTEKGRKRLKEINAELDKNNKKIADNSDKLKKQKLNVGNYSDSIKNAVNSSGLFSTQLAVLQRIQATLNAITKKNTVSTEANATAQKAAGVASGGFSKALKVLKIALISTGVGAIVVALGTLIAAFGSTQRGADAFTKVLRPLQAIFERFLGFLQDTGFKVFDRLKEAFSDPKQAVIDLATAIKDNLIARFKAIGVFGSAIAKLFRGEFADGFIELGDATVQLSTGVEDASGKIKTLTENTKDFIDVSLQQGAIIDDLIKRFERLEIDTTIPLAKLRLEFEKLKEISKDQTLTDQERLDAINKQVQIQGEITKIEQELLDLTIEKIELEQTFNDTSRKDELELVKLKEQRINFEANAAKKIGTLTAERSAIEKRINIENEKTAQRLKEQSQELETINTLSNARVETDKEELKISDDIIKKKQKEIDANNKAIADQIKKEEELQKITSEKRIKTAQKTADQVAKAFSDAFDKEEKALDESIARREESVSLQQSRAEQGLENQLAFEKEQLAKAELERARLAEKRAKQEEAAALAQAFLNAFASRSKDDPDTAAAKALTDVIIAKALSETVAGAFAEGVEDFKGEGTGTSDSNLIRFSHGESVVTAKGTKENQGLVTAMNNGDVGSWFANNMMLSPLSSEKNYDSFGILAQKIDSIEKAIRSRPTTQTNLDNMGNVLQSTYRNGIKNTVKYVNKPGII